MATERLAPNAQPATEGLDTQGRRLVFVPAPFVPLTSTDQLLEAAETMYQTAERLPQSPAARAIERRGDLLLTMALRLDPTSSPK